MTKKDSQATIFDTKLTNLVCKEFPINLTDEKLKSVLSKTYERARKDANKFRIYKHFGIFLSIGLTLLIALLTAEFKPLGMISGAVLQTICIILCCLTFVVGFIFLIMFAMLKDSNILDERDKAVNEIMESLTNFNN